MSRNGTGGEDELNSDGTRKVARVGSKSTSSRLNISDTIERNVDNINAVKVENDVVVDPMFHKMSKAFDEGGAKGMLMTNLRLCKGSAGILFNPDDVPAAPAAESCVGIDLSDLIAKASIDIQALIATAVCPAMDGYRETLGVAESAAGLLEMLSTSDDLGLPAVVPLASLQPAPTYTSTAIADYGDDYDDGPVGGDNDYDDYDHVSAPSTAPLQQPSQQHKIQWDAVFGGNASPSKLQQAEVGTAIESGAVLMAVAVDGGEAVTTTTALLQDLQLEPANDYGFLSENALGNAWAGAKHWKYASRARTAAAASINEDEQKTSEQSDAPLAAPTKSRSTASKKVKFTLDFTSAPDEASFAPPRLISETTLAASAVEKLTASAAGGEFLLPLDAKLSVRDLCRLFLVPKLLRPPSFMALEEVIQTAAPSSSSASTAPVARVWGVAPAATPSKSTSSSIEDRFGGADDYYDDEGGSGGDYGDDDFAPPANPAAPAASQRDDHLQGLEIDFGSLVQAKRTVEKIDIG